jgi:hypothetical protein
VKLPEAANFIHFDKADDYDDFVDYPMSIEELRNRIGITRCECDSREKVKITRIIIKSLLLHSW